MARADEPVQAHDLGATRAEIAAYLDATTPVPSHADLVFVPGTRLTDAVPIAAELMSRQVAPLVLVTGGVSKRTGVVEAHVLASGLFDAGVARDSVIVEDESTNTLENARRGWQVIEPLLTGPLTNVLCVCKWMHSRRVLMTLKAQWPAGITYYASTYAPLGLTRGDWVNGAPEAPSAEVMAHWHNIPTYLARGDIAEIECRGGGWV